jgi:hypothetical protein
MPRPKLSNIPIETLKKELDRRIARVEALKAQRDRLDREIAELEGLAVQTTRTAGRKRGPKPGRKRGPKPGRKPRATRGGAKPLKQYIQQVMAKAPGGMSTAAIEKAVIAAGYQTRAESIYNPILKVIRKGGYRKVSRGVYAVGSAPAARKAAKKAAKKAPAPAKAKGAHKRKKYDQTAEQFILGLVAGKGAISSDINKTWMAAGRTGRADNTLNKMLKAGKLKRQKIVGTKGSMYTVA